MKKQVSNIKSAVLMAMIIFSMCCFYPQMSFSLSVEEERAMGEKFLAEVRKQFRLLFWYIFSKIGKKG